MSWIKSVFTEEVRGWIYRVLVAVGLLVAGFGWATSDQIALIMGVVVAILNVMPSANTTIKKSAVDQYNIPE